ncbi:unnamed protein product [Arabidopsis halleri]
MAFSTKNAIYLRLRISDTRTYSSSVPRNSISFPSSSYRNLNRFNRLSVQSVFAPGVKQGGCSGMSYTMDFENKGNARPDDSAIEYGGFTIVCDPESMLFLFGLQLDYSDALIGGGFSFKNPNAS